MDVILSDGQEVRPPELAVQVDATAALEAGYADVSIAPTCSDLYELHLIWILYSRSILATYIIT